MLTTRDDDASRQLQACKPPTAMAADDVTSESLRRNAGLMDALSYVEPPMDSATERMVNSLIEEEMARGRGKKPEMPELRPLRLSAAMQQELERVDKGGEMAPLEIDRYSCEPPEPALASDPRAWKKAYENVCSQLEHQANRVVNLELAESFGACLLYTSPSPRDVEESRMPSSA